MIIHSYENGLRSDACVQYIRGLDCFEGVEELLLLPIPSTRDNKTILGTNIVIDSLISLVDGASLVVGYSLPATFKSTLTGVGCPVHDVGCDEEFLCENAELTAQAALGILLNTAGASVSDLRVGIVGYGRIGKRLARLLLCLGSSVRVYSSDVGKRLDLGEWGITTALSAKDADLSELDVLVNTAPAAIFDTEHFPEGLRVIDLASGDNFPGLSSVEKYPSIPAKMFPRSAGVAWGRSIERFARGLHNA